MELAQVIDEVLAEHPTENASEASLFKKAILLQQTELGRTPTKARIIFSWKRWQRERNLDQNAEPAIDTTKLYAKVKK